MKRIFWLEKDGEKGIEWEDISGKSAVFLPVN